MGRRARRKPLIGNGGENSPRVGCPQMEDRFLSVVRILQSSLPCSNGFSTDSLSGVFRQGDAPMSLTPFSVPPPAPPGCFPCLPAHLGSVDRLILHSGPGTTGSTKPPSRDIGVPATGLALQSLASGRVSGTRVPMPAGLIQPIGWPFPHPRSLFSFQV